MSIEFGFAYERVVARAAPNGALVFGHVVSQRLRVGQNLFADFARRVAQVDLKVLQAARSVQVRPLAHTATESPITFHYYSKRLPMSQRIACKF
jgi:hypothetical protein